MDVNIVSFQTTPIAVLEHHGAPERLDESIRKFIEWRKRSQLSPIQTNQTYGIAYNDPETTAPEAFRFDICGEVSQPVPDNPQGVITKEIPGGRCAVVRHVGSHEQMGDTLQALYRAWLPSSGETVRDFPCFFHYLNLSPDIPETERITDIYLPLK